jgi:class II lanthipeptide synthase
MSSDEFLNAAAAIGRDIAAQAVWDDGCCSWMGAAVEPAERSRPEYQPIGPLVYNGTAGIGLFLAQLAAATDEGSLRRTAAGAVRHALGRASTLPDSERDGLQAGTLGIAWAAARVAVMLGAEELAEGARTVLDQAAPVPGPGRCPDLVLGAAGAILALLGLADALGEPRLLAAAGGIGEGLLEDATVTRRGWSWADPARPSPHHLCGVAHGAGGIGGALLELFAATHDARFLAGATGAFAYERSWLDRRSGTWPDLRLPARRGAAGTTMIATWCCGEAGIALSRLRAGALLGEGSHRVDADVSIETTSRHLAARLPYAIDDLSLCHGAGGSAAALLEAGERDAAAALGRVALDRYGKRGDWPCGAYGTTPGLFRGLSGIGWLFLCLHDPEIPSPLVLPAQG